MITCGNCKASHQTAAEVRNCYGNSGHLPQAELPMPDADALRRAAEASTSKTVAEVQVNLATTKQLAFIDKLAAERGDAGFRYLETIDLPHATKNEASRVIDHLFTLPKVKEADAELDLDAKHLQRGAVHVIDGTYYRVHVGQKSGKPYVVRAHILAEATWVGDRITQAGEVEWEMAKGMINRLTPETMATRDESRAFGHLVGRCCFCSTAIDTPESTTAGYGPVCAQKYGLPWGATLQLLTSAAIDDGFAPLAVK